MSEKPWYPDLDNPDAFLEHKNPLGDTPRIKVPDPEEDTAPLQGSKDLSDADSLPDVIAGTYDPDAPARKNPEPKP